MDKDGYGEFRYIINQLVDTGLEDIEIASIFNLPTYKIKKFRKNKKDSKIDGNKFIDMWKENIPIDIIAKRFGVSTGALYRFKRKHYPDTTRIQICTDCGTGFETQLSNRELCTNCGFEHRICYFNHLRWKKKLDAGSLKIQETRDKYLKEEEMELIQKLQDKNKINETHEWWEYG